MKKMTFTLDAASAREIERASQRLSIPKSQVVREAVHLYGEHLGRLDDAERNAKVALFDEVVEHIPDRPRAEVDAELAEVSRTRRLGGRATGPEMRGEPREGDPA